MRGVRRKTAEHLAESWNTIPHVTQHDRADITELEQLRARFAPKAEQAGGKMTVTAIALKVCAAALKVFPQFNASIDMEKEEIVYKQYIHIGVAADTDRGLLVPVIRDVDKKNIVELAVELSQLSQKARDKKITLADMEGGTFTITNLGGIGGTAFTPDCEPPRSGDSRTFALAHGTGMDWREIRTATDPAALALLRSSPDRRRGCGALSALGGRGVRTAFFAERTGVKSHAPKELILRPIMTDTPDNTPALMKSND